LSESSPASSAAEKPLPLLLGEAPSKQGDRYHAFPLSGAPAQRICRLMGWEPDGAAYWTLVEHFQTLNAIERHADAYPWSAQKARERWGAWLLENCGEGRLTVVCVGRKAAAAVGLSDGVSWGQWRAFMAYDATVLPHTSGRNRVWNEPGTAELWRRVLTEAIERAS
jgi:hypothetical protein